jgi:transposase
VIPVSSSVRVWLATGTTDMRCGMNGLALQVQQVPGRDPHAGDLYVFRGKRGDLIKVLWHDGLGMSLNAKRLERGKFIWPSPADGMVPVTAAQLGYMLEGIVWTPSAGQVRRWYGSHSRMRVCVRPVDAATKTAGPDGVSAARGPHFDFALVAHPLQSGVSGRRSGWRSINLLRSDLQWAVDYCIDADL